MADTPDQLRWAAFYGSLRSDVNPKPDILNLTDVST
jgi:hypothetical protein